MRSINFGFTVLALIGLLGAIMPAGADDWPCFLGPNRDSISRETGLLKEWPANGPKELWTKQLGLGYSSISVVGDRLYTMYQDDNGQYVTCRNVADGALVWETKTGPAYTAQRNWPGPRDTPTIDGDVLYAFDANGELVCLSVKDGSKVWGFNVLDKFKGKNLTWGCAMSPLVVGDVLYVDAGEADGASVVALNKKNGETIWKAHDYLGGYASPEIGEIDGKTQVVFFTGEGPIGVSPTDGKQYWHFPWKTSYDIHATKPIIFDNNRVFISSGYGVGSAMLKIENDKAQPIWKNDNLESKHGALLYYKGYLYGNANKRREFRCVDPANGDLKWGEKGFGTEGTYMIADDLCYALGDKGNLALAEISPEGFKKISEFQPLEDRKSQVWAQPVVSNGKLFLRDNTQLRCYDVKAN